MSEPLPRAGIDAADLSGAVLRQECGDRLGEHGGGARERVGFGAEEAEHVREADPADDGARWSSHRDAGCGARAGHPPERGGKVAGGGGERERPHGRLADAQVRHLIGQEAHCHALAGRALGGFEIETPFKDFKEEGERRGTGRRFLEGFGRKTRRGRRGFSFQPRLVGRRAFI